MEDDVSQGDEEGLFTLELTPSQMYSLNTVLRYNIINMDDPAYSQTCEVLAKTVHESMVSEKFDSAMEDEFEEYIENTDGFSGSPGGEPISPVGREVQ